ncbi:MAG: serine hydrolase, partial [Candidatus Competibacterales bacterium]|nr:serine hydrolase [Candidatus Competibacterales bacterium]
YLNGMPPRIAAWRPNLGCTALPIGADPAMVANLPTVELPPPERNPANVPWPDGDQLIAEGAVPHLDVDALNDTVAAAFDARSYGEGTATTAVVILRNGEIVAERYREDFDRYTSQRTWSVAKSLSATLIGIAVGQGLLELDAPAPVPEWQRPGDPRRAITLANLLHMSSGLYSGIAGNRTDFIYFGGGPVTEHATRHPLEVPPGSRGKYANNDTMLALRALRAALNDDQRYLAFPFSELLHKIGMYHTYPETDWQGNFVGSSQVWTTARDLARLGLLYLQRGRWNGEQIFPAWWADYVATPAPSQIPARSDRPQRGYGAQFWLYHRIEALPDDTHAMLGNRGQIVMLVPSRNVVIVRRGFDPSGTGVRFDEITFGADVLAAFTD